jgi:hypothetical protein
MTSALVGGKWSASRPCRFTPGERAPRYPLNKRLVDPRAGLDNVEKRKLLTLPGLELRPLGRPARSQSLYRLSYRGQLVKIQPVVLWTVIFGHRYSTTSCLHLNCRSTWIPQCVSGRNEVVQFPEVDGFFSLPKYLHHSHLLNQWLPVAIFLRV